MSNLKEFDSTLQELETEVGKLKVVSDAYQKVQGLVDTSAKVNHRLELTQAKLDQVSESSDLAIKDLVASIKTTEIAQQDLVSKSTTLIDTKIEEIRQENKKFYRDLEDTIKRRLDDNRLEIKLLIESERAQIKEIFTKELANNTNSLEAELKKTADQLNAKHQQTRTMVIAMGAITILLSAGILIKLLVS